MDDALTLQPKLLVAAKPEEMQVAQDHLAAWFTKKIKDCRNEYRDVAAALAVAEKSRWATAALRSQVSRAKGRLIFYGKCLSAVKAGFALIPEFPIDLFAVRTKRTSPDANYSTSNWNNASFQKSQPNLPVGVGGYVSDEARREVADVERTKDSSGHDKVVTYYRNSDFRDVVFPLKAVKAEVMTATARAMGMRIFDEIGLCPQSSRKDPMIIGRILGPKIGYTQTALNFLICWFIDLKEL